MATLPDAIATLFSELRRRKVYRAAVLYLAGAFVALQVAEIVVDGLRLPAWVLTMVILGSIMGLPVAIALAWAFDITRGGIQRAEDAGVALGWLPRAAMVVLVLLASGGAGAAAWRFGLADRVRAGEPSTAAADTEPGGLDPTRLAVLYFDDHSQGSRLGYLADGLTEELIHRLARIPAFWPGAVAHASPAWWGSQRRGTIARSPGCHAMAGRRIPSMTSIGRERPARTR